MKNCVNVRVGVQHCFVRDGWEYQVEIRANIAGGGEYSQTKILSPQ